MSAPNAPRQLSLPRPPSVGGPFCITSGRFAGTASPLQAAVAAQPGHRALNGPNFTEAIPSPSRTGGACNQSTSNSKLIICARIQQVKTNDLVTCFDERSNSGRCFSPRRPPRRNLRAEAVAFPRPGRSMHEHLYLQRLGVD